ncbi:OmpA family protein [Ferruginibacter sp. HRS2-29]|uniref:OmpA family protein n=1 Tax=Ferruginibacter sp. HRS2-29 TaxID=2487334 RepID=UPI0020CE0BA1|nr:OmpA family protein [Ferruginibacter sp. HRS2-29]MCP9750483.1 OmpA family protein [Ferruginibacter sp. HRS2-29]
MSVHHDEATPVQQQDSMSGGLKILLPVLLLCLIAAGIFYMTRGSGDAGHDAHGGHDSTATHENHDQHGAATAHEGAATHVTGKLDTLTGDFIYDLGENVEIELPNNGGKLTVGKNSTEYQLVQFLNNKSAALDTVKGNWFEFTNVRFKSGGAELTEGSEAQLKNLVAIAKAYPAAQFKIGGYTDNSGDKAKNLALSQKRADAVAAKAKGLGAAATSIISAEGYGIEHPIADNATAEGRAQNRRVAVNVKAK